MFLRTPQPNEPPCSNGERCYGHTIKDGGERLVAHWPPAIWEAFQRNPTDYEFNGDAVCVLCKRYEAALLINEMRICNEMPREPQSLVCSFVNIVNADGEYYPEDCIGPTRIHNGTCGFFVQPNPFAFKRHARANGIVYFEELLPVYRAGQPRVVPEALRACF